MLINLPYRLNRDPPFEKRRVPLNKLALSKGFMPTFLIKTIGQDRFEKKYPSKRAFDVQLFNTPTDCFHPA